MDVSMRKENLPSLDARLHRMYYNEKTGEYEEMVDTLETIKKEYPDQYEEFKKILNRQDDSKN